MIWQCGCCGIVNKEDGPCQFCGQFEAWKPLGIPCYSSLHELRKSADFHKRNAEANMWGTSELHQAMKDLAKDITAGIWKSEVD